MSVGALMVEIAANTARFQNDMGKMVQIADQRAREMDKIFGIVENSLKAMGAAAAIGLTMDKMKSKIEESIQSAAGLKELAERTGGTVEKLSGLASVAKLSGTDTDALATGIQKLSKNMVDVAGGGIASTEAFKAIGISVNEIKGQRPDAVFELIAKRMANYADGAEKTAVAQALLGKAGANLLPMMHDIAEVGDIVAKTTDEQVAMAKEYTNTIIKLSAAQNAIYKVVAMEVLPVMNAFSKAMLESATSTDGLGQSAQKLAKEGSLREWAEDTAQVIGVVIDGFDATARMVQILGKGIGAYAASLAAVMNKDADLAFGVLKEYGADVDEILNKTLFSTRLQKQLEAAKKNKGDAEKPKPDYNPNAAQSAAAILKRELEASLKDQEIFLSNQKQLLQDRQHMLDAAHSLEYLTLRDSEERKMQLYADNLVDQQNAYTEEIAALNRYIVDLKKTKGPNFLEEQIRVKTKIIEIINQQSVAEQEANKRIVESQLKVLEVQRRFDLATKEQARQDSIANQSAQFNLDMMGQSTLEILLANDARRIQLQLEERIYQLRKLDENADTSEAITKSAEQTQRSGELIVAAYQKQRDGIFGAQEALRKYVEESTNAGAQIERALSNAFKGMEDALVQFVTTGKLNFASLANAIISDLVRIQVQRSITGPLANAMLGSSFPSWAASLFGGARATGGPVAGGTTYLVGENGPELFTPSMSGGITPNSALGGVTINIKNEGAADGYQASASTSQNGGQMNIDVMISKAMRSDVRSNGPMTQALSQAFGLQRRAI